MARNQRLINGIQVFRGSRSRQDVFAVNSGSGCCNGVGDTAYDKLAERTRFDNSLAHSNPTGANDKFTFPYGDGFADTRDNIITLINDVGVGAHISVLAIPTYAFVTGVGVHIEAEEPGLTFDLVTRNGLVLPTNTTIQVSAEAVTACEIVRTQTDPGAGIFEGFGALGTAAFIDLFGRNAEGEFSLEADEIALRVATMPANGIVNGTFKLTVAVSYDVIHRAEH